MYTIQKSGVVAILALLGSFALAAPPSPPATEPKPTGTSTSTSTTTATATATFAPGDPAAPTIAPMTEKPSLHPFAKRGDDRCYSGGSFQSSDFWAIENSFYAHDNWHWMDSATCRSWTWGTVKVCVCNRYYFEATSVYDRTIGDALSHVGNCCLTSICNGGESTISGNTGLWVDVEAVPSWSGC